MGWVVKEWRPEGVAALAAGQTHEAGQAVASAAEREARRMQRAMDREQRAGEAWLSELEALGSELRERVRGQRRSLRAGARRDDPRRPDVTGAAVGTNGRRSRLRDSPLASLFQATERRGNGSPQRVSGAERVAGAERLPTPPAPR
jgi:hypothetical protein